MNSKSFLFLALTVLAGNLAVHAQSTAFTYQGRLTDSSGSPQLAVMICASPSSMLRAAATCAGC